MIHAVLKEDLYLVDELLGRRAKTEIKDRDGLTALVHATGIKDSLIVSSLIDAGASLKATDTKGESPISIAILNGHLPTIEVFSNRNIASYETLINLARNKNPQIIEELQAKRFKYLWHSIVNWDAQEFFQRLAKSDVDEVKDWQDDQGYTLLMIAAEQGYAVDEHSRRRVAPDALPRMRSLQKIITHLILERVASAKIVNREGKTALDLFNELHPSKPPKLGAYRGSFVLHRSG